MNPSPKRKAVGPPLIYWNHTCDLCNWKWISDERDDNCPIPRCGGGARGRKRRKDAKEPKFEPLPLAKTREPRKTTLKTNENIRFHAKRERDIVPDKNDFLFAPTLDFTPYMRCTQNGETFNATRIGLQVLTVKTKAYQLIGVPAGRPATPLSVMGESASNHAAKHKQNPTVALEWCHLVADCLGGDTAKDNLFCGGYNANSHMLAIEGKLKGQTHLEVQVEAHCHVGTEFAEKVVYRVKNPKNGRVFEDTFDSLSEGFSVADHDKVGRTLKDWLQKYGKA